MVQIEAPSTPECWECVTCPDGLQEKEHRVVLQVQVEHYPEKSQDQNQSQKFLGLVLPVDYKSGFFTQG